MIGLGSQPLSKDILFPATLSEDTHKRSVFFSGRTTKGVQRLTPSPRQLRKKPFFSINQAFLAQKLEKKWQNPFQAIMRLKRKRKWHGP